MTYTIQHLEIEPRFICISSHARVVCDSGAPKNAPDSTFIHIREHTQMFQHQLDALTVINYNAKQYAIASHNAYQNAKRTNNTQRTTDLHGQAQHLSMKKEELYRLKTACLVKAFDDNVDLEFVQHQVNHKLYVLFNFGTHKFHLPYDDCPKRIQHKVNGCDWYRLDTWKDVQPVAEGIGMKDALTICYRYIGIHRTTPDRTKKMVDRVIG